MGIYYWKFIKEWEKIYPEKIGFYGLRDFYNLIKYICKKIGENRQSVNL